MNGNAPNKFIGFLVITLLEIEFPGQRSCSTVAAFSSSPSGFFRRLNYHQPRLQPASTYSSEEEDDNDDDKYRANDIVDGKSMTMKFHRNDGLLFHRSRPFQHLPFLRDPFHPATSHFISRTKQSNDKLFIVLEDGSKCGGTENGTAEVSDQPDQGSPATSKAQAEANQVKPQPSPCVWAIIACCAPTNYHFWYGCFHYLGCTAAFWEADPCQLSVVLFASRQAVSYYEQFEKPPVAQLPPIQVTITTSQASPSPSPSPESGTPATITEGATAATITDATTGTTQQETPKTDEPTTTTTVQTTTEVPSTEPPTAQTLP